MEKPWDLKLAVKNLDLDQALTFAGKGKAFAGVFDGKIALAGRGRPSTVEKTLDGNIGGNLKNGAFLGADLVSAVAGPWPRCFPSPPRASGAGKPRSGKNLAMAIPSTTA